MVNYKALKGSLKKSVNYRELTLHALANLVYIKNIAEVEGPFGKLVKFGARMAKKQIDAALELAICKTTACTDTGRWQKK